MMNILYGIPNCDTVKKARKWLEENHIEYEFHDFRKDGVNPVQLRVWANDPGWEKLLNKRSTTWRQLPDETKQNINEAIALVVMEEQPTIIKRPVLETSTQRVCGFSAIAWSELFGIKTTGNTSS